MTRSKDSFGVHTSTILEHLWNYKKLTDITLASEDKTHIKLHKVITGSASTLFQNILQPNFNEPAHVNVNDVKYNYLEIVFKVIYLGWCDLGQEDISEFLATGEALGISDLLIENVVEYSRKDKISHIEKNTEDVQTIQRDMPTVIDIDTLFAPLDHADC